MSRRYGYGGWWGYGGFGPYVSVAEKRQRAERAAQRLAKSGRKLQPIEVAGREICHTWWGLSWCRNLEFFADFANRLPRGRTYVRSGAVLDLQIEPGRVHGLVQGSELYEVEIKIRPLPAERKRELCDRCAADIGSTIDLLSGKLDRNIMNILAEPKRGLFPEPREIEFDCSCPDIAEVCKHVAAVLYGIGVRFDASPELFFTLRGIDPAEFAAAATTGLSAPEPLPRTDDTLAGASRQELGAVFGIEFTPETADAGRPGGSGKSARAIAAVEVPMPGAPPRQPSPVEAYVDSLFDPHTGQPVEVDPAPPGARGTPPENPATRVGPAQTLRAPRMAARERAPEIKTKASTKPPTSEVLTKTSRKSPTSSAHALSAKWAPHEASRQPASAASSGGRRSAMSSPARSGGTSPAKRTAKVTGLPGTKAASAKPALRPERPLGKQPRKKAPKSPTLTGKSVRAGVAAKPSPDRSSRKPARKPPARGQVGRLRERCRPGNLLTMAELRAQGISYTAVQRALLDGHLTISAWRGEYGTTRTTLAWFDALWRQQHG